MFYILAVLVGLWFLREQTFINTHKLGSKSKNSHQYQSTYLAGSSDQLLNEIQFTGDRDHALSTLCSGPQFDKLSPITITKGKKNLFLSSPEFVTLANVQLVQGGIIFSKQYTIQIMEGEEDVMKPAAAQQSDCLSRILLAQANYLFSLWFSFCICKMGETVSTVNLR